MNQKLILENWRKFLKEEKRKQILLEGIGIAEEKKSKSDDRCTRIAKRKYDVWPCVPMYSEALTKEGWKRYDQLIIGETILSYDIESDTLKWTEIKNLHFYENAKTTKMSKQFFEVVSTPDHRWVAYNKNMGHKKIINNEKIDLIFNTIKEVNEEKISLKEAEEKCNSFRYYYKKYNNKTIDEILQGSKNSKGGVKLIETKNLTNSMGLLTTARLDDNYRPSQLGKISKYGENWISKILNMSVDQIDSFFASAIIYDGNQITDLMLEKNVGVRKTENTYGFKQKDKMHGDIFELAAFLSGRNVMRGEADKDNITSFYIRDKRYIPLDVVKFEEHTQQDVWCPETIYGTWVMRQNSRIMITGNSAYASGAVVRCRQGKIWKGVSENASDQEIDDALLLEEIELILEKDPKVGTGKKPKSSDRRLYTDENPKDTVSVKFSTVQDIKDTLSKESFKSKPHARQSQIINLIHQRTRSAHKNAKDPEVKARLKKSLDYAEERKETSKEKTKTLQKEQQIQLNEKCWKGYTQKGMKTMFGKKYPNCVKVTKESVDLEEANTLEEEWSEKYKSSIDCKNPKGFSQKAHCQGKKKNEDIDLGEVEIIEEAKKKAYKPNFSKEKEQGLHGWFARNDGKGWVNCRTGGPCGRDNADKGGKYPACRPTKAQCKSAGKGPLRKKKSSSPISWTKKKKD